MTDRPIIFSAPMIRALLEGRKTQTRRVIKPQPKGLSLPARPEYRGGRSWVFMNRVDFPSYAFAGDDFKTPCTIGDRLWVRENWAHDVDITPYVGLQVYYSTDVDLRDNKTVRQRPSIHMPRWASRLTLIVESVKVERLQDISEADAISEGIETTEYWREDHPPSICFSVLWDSINGHDAWNANPWVCAIGFKVVKENIDAPCEEVAP
jgi:hypothetical protein